MKYTQMPLTRCTMPLLGGMACLSVLLSGGLADARVTESRPNAQAQAQITVETPMHLAQVSPADGTVEAGRYSNSFFGLSLQFPETWAIATDQMTQALQETGTDMMLGDDEELREAAENSLQNTYTLLMVSEFPLDAAMGSNPNLVLMAERLPAEAGITSETVYLEVLEQLLVRSPLPYSISQAPYPIELGGRTFYRLDTDIVGPAGSLEQSYITLLQEDYILTFILTGEASDMPELEAIASSLNF